MPPFSTTLLLSLTALALVALPPAAALRSNTEPLLPVDSNADAGPKKPRRQRAGWFGKTKNLQEPLTIFFMSGEKKAHTDSGWEFLALKDDAVKEVGQAMLAQKIRIFAEGHDEHLDPTLLLQDITQIHPSIPLFAVQDENVHEELQSEVFLI
jgi:hypothetical protein